MSTIARVPSDTLWLDSKKLALADVDNIKKIVAVNASLDFLKSIFYAPDVLNVV
jgi:hypothetical protein